MFGVGRDTGVVDVNEDMDRIICRSYMMIDNQVLLHPLHDTRFLLGLVSAMHTHSFSLASSTSRILRT